MSTYRSHKAITSRNTSSAAPQRPFHVSLRREPFHARCHRGASPHGGRYGKQKNASMELPPSRFEIISIGIIKACSFDVNLVFREYRGNVFLTSMTQLLCVSPTSPKHVDTTFSTTQEGENMAKREAGSVFQKEDGYWGYRFIVTINGKRIERRGSFDECGNKFRTKHEAYVARELAIVSLRTEKNTKPKPVRRKVKEVFEEYSATGRKDRAYRTIQKQDSLWENHLRDRFGSRYVDEISSADVIDYLSELYYVDHYAFKYTGSAKVTQHFGDTTFG